MNRILSTLTTMHVIIPELCMHAFDLSVSSYYDYRNLRHIIDHAGYWIQRLALGS